MYMAVDQYGRTEHGLIHPRRDLMQRVGVQHAEKIYVDNKVKGRLHVGYVIGQRWFTLYHVARVERPI